MPIKGVSEVRRVPRVGKVRLGVKAVSEKGKEYPRAVDYFVIDPDDGITSPAAAKVFSEVYGDKPRSLDIMLPDDDPGTVFPQWLQQYGSGAGLVCRGDGESARRVDPKTGEMMEVDCEPEECPAYTASPPKCRRVATLQFLLPKLPGIGVWMIQTTSFHSIVAVNSAIEFITGLTGGRLRFLPLTLRVVPREVSPDGKKKVVFCLDLQYDKGNLVDMLHDAQRSPAELILPPLDESRSPDDLYARSVREAALPEAPLPEGDDLDKMFRALRYTEGQVKAAREEYRGRPDELRQRLSLELDRQIAADEAKKDGRLL